MPQPVYKGQGHSTVVKIKLALLEKSSRELVGDVCMRACVCVISCLRLTDPQPATGDTTGTYREKHFNIIPLRYRAPWDNIIG